MDLEMPEDKPFKAKGSALTLPPVSTVAKVEKFSKVNITFDTVRWSKIEEVLKSYETEMDIKFQVEKGLLRKRIKVSMYGPADEVDDILRMIEVLG